MIDALRVGVGTACVTLFIRQTRLISKHLGPLLGREALLRQSVYMVHLLLERLVNQSFFRADCSNQN
jgi:hypothetical protein